MSRCPSCNYDHAREGRGMFCAIVEHDLRLRLELSRRASRRALALVSDDLAAMTGYHEIAAEKRAEELELRLDAERRLTEEIELGQLKEELKDLADRAAKFERTVSDAKGFLLEASERENAKLREKVEELSMAFAESRLHVERTSLLVQLYGQTARLAIEVGSMPRKDEAGEKWMVPRDVPDEPYDELHFSAPGGRSWKVPLPRGTRFQVGGVPRCPERESGGVQCELPAGHEGRHACPEALEAFRRAR